VQQLKRARASTASPLADLARADAIAPRERRKPALALSSHPQMARRKRVGEGREIASCPECGSPLFAIRRKAAGQLIACGLRPPPSRAATIGGFFATPRDATPLDMWLMATPSATSTHLVLTRPSRPFRASGGR
jgi:hypothetical protein